MQVIQGNMRSAPALAVVALASLHMLALGSFHDHEYTEADHLTSSHHCFLCHVSSSVDIDAPVNVALAAMPGHRAPAAPHQIEPPAPLVSTCSARSPPSL